MYISIVTIVVVALAATAQALPGVVNNRCSCFPQSFNGKILIADRLLQRRNGGHDIHFGVDFNAQKFFLRHRGQQNGRRFDWSFGGHFGPAGMIYIINNIEGGCMRTPTYVSMIKRCLFNNNNFRGQRRIGSGDHSILGLMYVLNAMNGGDQSGDSSSSMIRELMLLVLSQENCMPIMQNPHNRLDLAIMFYEMNTGYGDEQDVTMPTGNMCEDAPFVTMPEPLQPSLGPLSRLFFPELIARPCCGPSQMHASMSEMMAFSKLDGSSTSEGFFYLPNFYVDYANRVAAGNELMYSNGVMFANITFLSYFNGNTFVVNNTDGNCTASVTPAIYNQLTQCVPPDATYLGSMKLGHGLQSLRVNGWQTTMNSGDTNITAQTMLTSLTCMPVMGSFEGTNQDQQFVASWLMSDFSPRIQNPSSAFALPTACNGIPTPYTSSNDRRGRGNNNNYPLHLLAVLKYLNSGSRNINWLPWIIYNN